MITKALKFYLLPLCLLMMLAAPAVAADGDSFTTMTSGALTATAEGLRFEASPVTASLTFFNDRTTFDNANPGLTLEDFNNGNVPPFGIVGCGDPLTNGDPCFAPDGIEPGISLVSSSGNGTVLLAPGLVGNPTTAVAANFFADANILVFSTTVFAVGFDLFVAGPPGVDISIFGLGGVLLGQTSTTAGFFGVVSDTQIESIVVDSGGFGEVIDEVLFGVSDSDGDGIPDADDACPASDLSATVVIDSCDSGVGNTLFEDGCTIADLAAACADGANNHGQYVSCVSHLTNELKAAGIVSGREKGSIQSCAARSDLP